MRPALYLLFGLLLLTVLLVAGCSGSKTTHVTMTGTPNWVAFQDGNGAWQVLQPTQASSYSMDVTDPGGRYGFAYWDGSTMHIFLATLAEVARIPWLGQSSVTHALSGAIANTGSGDWLVSCGGAVATGTGDGGYGLFAVPEGTHDLTALLGDMPPGKMFLQRALAVTADTTADVDFSASNAYALTSPHVVTITGASGTWAENMTWGSEWVILGQGTSTATFNYSGVPDANRQAVDRYRATITTTLGERYAYYAATADRTIDAGITPFTTAAVTSEATTPYWRPTIGWSTYTGASCYELSLGDGMWDIVVTPGWLGTASPSVTVPDFSALAGWDASMGLSPGFAEASALTVSATLQDFYNAAGGSNPYPDGMTATQARCSLSSVTTSTSLQRRQSRSRTSLFGRNVPHLP